MSESTASPGTEEKAKLLKCPTGIKGLDEITEGGLPRGRTSLVCGGPGCGKTTMAMEFLVRGATEFDEPGVFVSFEEKEQELAANFESMGFDLGALEAQGKLSLDFIRIERSEIYETGDFDLDGLFVRLALGIDSIGAKRVVLDTIEVLFAALPNEAILRAELRRLFSWLKEKGVTSIVTGEQGEKTLTRHGLEEYVADCVIFLDHRIADQISTRRLRVVKYRGSAHGSNEYPFLIGNRGFSVLPITSLGLDYAVSKDRVSTGVERLDTMLGGGGFFKGSTVLVSGSAGTGKSSLSASFARSVCESGKRCLYFAFEEAPQQILRNMETIGIHLRPCVDRGLLRFQADRSTFYGLEMHLLKIHSLIEEFRPEAVIFDPLTNLMGQGTPMEVKSMATRLIDFLKGNGITALFTCLTSGEHRNIEGTEVEISSLIDTWILLRDIELQGERNRGIYILKSRGMAHSNQVREFLITSDGIDLLDVYLGPEGVLTGSARTNQEAREQVEATLRTQRIEMMRKEMERKRQALQAQLTALEASYASDLEEIGFDLAQEEMKEAARLQGRADMSRLRRAEADNGSGNPGSPTEG